MAQSQVQVMSHLTAEGVTNHEAEVTAMRLLCFEKRTLLDSYAEARSSGLVSEKAIQRVILDVVVLDAAADLLECHDATGVTLDDWTGPKALVHEALAMIGLEPHHLLANGV